MLNKQKVLTDLKQDGKVKWGEKKTLGPGLEKMKKKNIQLYIVYVGALWVKLTLCLGGKSESEVSQSCLTLRPHGL